VCLKRKLTKRKTKNTLGGMGIASKRRRPIRTEPEHELKTKSKSELDEMDQSGL